VVYLSRLVLRRRRYQSLVVRRVAAPVIPRGVFVSRFFQGFRWPFITYYLTVSVVGYAALAYWWKDLDPAHLIQYLVFILLTIVADLVNLNLPRGGASISVSTPVTFAAIVILGPGPAAWVEAVSALVVEGIVNRRPPMKIVFNVPVLALSVGVAGIVFQALPFGGIDPDFSTPYFLIPLVVMGVVHYFVNTYLVGMIIALSEGRRLIHIWKTNFGWIFRHVITFVPITAIVILVYQLAPWTLALFIIPILLVRYAYKLYLDMREVHISSLAALASALDAKDPYTHGHSYRVSRYALLIGEEMNLNDSQLQALEYAALLHDLGKIGIDGEIIAKPGKLTPEEYEMMKTHPAKGAKIIERLRFLKEAADVVKYHHERVDGKGYPEGLMGEKIPMMARILHVCDTFDAMTSSRPYREALSLESTLDELREHRGTQFDEAVVDALLALHERGSMKTIRDDVPFEIYEALSEA
jgi:putative nucleotidyltransferase with HDIG domain